MGPNAVMSIRGDQYELESMRVFSKVNLPEGMSTVIEDPGTVVLIRRHGADADCVVVGGCT